MNSGGGAGRRGRPVGERGATLRAAFGPEEPVARVPEPYQAVPGLMQSIETPDKANATYFAGMAFAFIHSFTDINMSLFIAKPGQRPVTVAIMSFLDFGFAPTLAALSILSLLIPLVLIAILGRFVGIGNFLYQEQGRG